MTQSVLLTLTNAFNLNTAHLKLTHPTYSHHISHTYTFPYTHITSLTLTHSTYSHHISHTYTSPHTHITSLTLTHSHILTSHLSHQHIQHTHITSLTLTHTHILTSQLTLIHTRRIRNHQCNPPLRHRQNDCHLVVCRDAIISSRDDLWTELEWKIRCTLSYQQHPTTHSTGTVVC